jgi:alpha-amylase/alpha-mannosidase (GH57 family)
MPASKRYVCIHGHFYQPPRENPWLETVETQDTAAPYHDWNERICAECYAPNGAARIVNNKNQIQRIVNNYARTSFNFGPTLLSWLNENAPRTYRMVLDGERRSRKSYGGHSSAMAQVYNHIILPLASPRDRVTQIRWGIADYEHHYGAPPEGMWLAETAADTESLELLAQHGIKFTLLAPHQCKRIRPLKDAADWTETPDATVDTMRPYLVRFASGASIAVFFYNGPISRAIAFEGLLNSGESLAARLKSGFKDNSQPQLVHVATDGESYGHHHKYGEMALAYALRLLEADKTVKLANYGSYLEQFPPEFEAEIIDNTSWSCQHGVERWRSDCGCNGGKAGFNQLWRAPLRQALDELRDAVAPLTEQEGGKFFKDVWAARDGYIEVILDRGAESLERFFSAHESHTLTELERVRARQLMEMQRHAQLMYTSCGWFFDDIAGIETVQVIAYAARVLQLAQELFGQQAESLQPAFLARGRGPLQRGQRRQWRRYL